VRDQRWSLLPDMEGARPVFELLVRGADALVLPGVLDPGADDEGF
jgi:hypothetical protein